MKPVNNIHPTAVVSKKAEIGNNVTIGPFTIIYDNVVIGENTVIEAYCEIGYPTKLANGDALVIGKDSLIRSHSIFYQGSSFDEGMTTGHHVIMREKIKAGMGLQLGSLVDFQGGCTIGDYVNYVTEHLSNYIFDECKNEMNKIEK
jgi:acyl-[acyl carrier protein]--UDP-N-acetylglucosamine O-acyltransferase